MDKRRKILVIILIFLCVLSLSIIIFVNVYNLSYVKYSDEKLNQIANYLEIDTSVYEDLHNNLIDNVLEINDIEDIELNKFLTSIIISNKENVNGFSYDECNYCYKYFSKYDNINYYYPKDVSEISLMLFGRELDKINQDDYAGYNVLYYNADIDMYYTNVIHGDNINSLYKLKDYKQEKDNLYFDYYYAKVFYQDELINKDLEESPTLTDNLISLYDINNILIMDNIPSDSLKNIEISEEYSDKLDIIRYNFTYDKKIKQYKMTKIELIEK